MDYQVIIIKKWTFELFITLIGCSSVLKLKIKKVSNKGNALNSCRIY